MNALVADGKSYINAEDVNFAVTDVLLEAMENKAPGLGQMLTDVHAHHNEDALHVTMADGTSFKLVVEQIG